MTDNDRGTQTDKNRDWDTDGKQTSKQTEQAYSGFERSRKRYGLTTCTKACIQTLNTVHCADGTPPPPTPRHPPHRTPSNHLSHTIFANETTYYGCGNTSRTIRNKAERPHSTLQLVVKATTPQLLSTLVVERTQPGARHNQIKGWHLNGFVQQRASLNRIPPRPRGTANSGGEESFRTWAERSSGTALPVLWSLPNSLPVFWKLRSWEIAEACPMENVCLLAGDALTVSVSAMFPKFRFAAPLLKEF